MKKAVAYFRTSSASNVGEDKDSLKRQQVACRNYAKENAFDINAEFYDANVPGKDLLTARPGFSDLIDFCEQNEIKHIIFETASRFSRELFIQEMGWKELTEAGYELVCSDAPEYFSSENLDPSRKMIRQILGSVAEFQKDELVAKLKGARERKRKVNQKKGEVTLSGKGKCEGRKSWKEKNTELIKITKKLGRKNPKTGHRRSRRKIAKMLYEQNFKTASGTIFGSEQIKRLLMC
jgi:DNA invertase Pin-like site-specific DNA recombinase